MYTASRRPRGPNNTSLASGIAHDDLEFRAKGVDSQGERANWPWDDEAARRSVRFVFSARAIQNSPRIQQASAALLRARRLDSREVEESAVDDNDEESELKEKYTVSQVVNGLGLRDNLPLRYFPCKNVLMATRSRPLRLQRARRTPARALDGPVGRRLRVCTWRLLEHRAKRPRRGGEST